jgi:hypothetical protein
MPNDLQVAQSSRRTAFDHGGPTWCESLQAGKLGAERLSELAMKSVVQK